MQTQNAKKNIILIGFMGCGKSTLSHYMAKHYALQEIDLDAQIVQTEDMPISEIFAQKGEAYFRTCETQSIIGLANTQNSIISCGGGAVLKPENVSLLRSLGKIVLLTATPATIYNRVKHSTARPILNDNMSEEYIAQLMQKRMQAYTQAADIIVSTDEKSIATIATEILQTAL